MTFREKIAELLRATLHLDDDYILNQSDEALTLADAIKDLSEDADRLLSEEGPDYIVEFEGRVSSLEAASAEFLLAFPGAENVRLFLALANRLTSDRLDLDVPPDLDGVRLDPHLNFDVPFTADGTPLRAFAYEDTVNPQNSVSFLDLTTDLPASDFDQARFSWHLTSIICLLVGQADGKLAAGPYIISTSGDEEKRQVYLKYQLLLHGAVLTRPFASPQYNSVAGIPASLAIITDFRQFKEPFDILSEVNSRSTVLDTYLSSYHVLENYMIRTQIVAVERRTAGTLFGVRQFKSLGNAVSSAEIKHLTHLFTCSWNKTIGGQRLDHFTDACTTALWAKAAFDAAEFDSLLDRLEVKAAGAPLGSPATFRQHVPKLLYAARSAIVHNKETEYHISNRELRTPTILITLTDLCIPVMQRLGFGLPSIVADNPISYSQQHLSLY